jgi:Tat protein translocase TatB subunit
MFGIGLPELILIMALALLVLGPQRLPEVARLVGRAYAQLRRASEEFQNTIRQDLAVLERQEDAQRNTAVAQELRQRFADLEGLRVPDKEHHVHD